MPSSSPRGLRASRPVPSIVLVAFAALAAVLLPAPAAQAADRTVSGGRLDWGVKASFQSYVTGPVAQGSWSLAGGAGTVGGSRFRFHSARGSYDPGTGAFSAGYSGGVRFLGHREAGGANALDMTISRPTVRISGGRGTVHADVVSKDRASGRVTTRSQVPFASLDLSGVDMRGGGSSVALSGIPATLTAQGARAFAGYYPAGTALDPVSLSADVPGAAGPAPGKTGKSPENGSGDRGTSRAKGTGFKDAAVDWGVRRTYREYVTGSVARGGWKLTGGAEDGGALFRFTDGTGTYDVDRGTLDARFSGAVAFTGKDLDLTLSKVRVRVAKGKGTLAADVNGTDMARKSVSLITFRTGNFKPEDGLAVVAEAPAELTGDGAKAFGGMYRAGTDMDPVSLAVVVSGKAGLPPLPDLGSEPATPATPAGTAPGTASGERSPGEPDVHAASASGSFPATPVAVGAGAALAAAVAACLVVRGRNSRKRRDRGGPAPH